MTSAGKDVELIFLGTGTSGSVPNVSCLTAPPDQPPCKTCLSTLTPAGKKNIRRNTSAIIRIPGPKDTSKTILVDCGKNFQSAAVEWFLPFKLRRIDALLITHAHADAMNGLDDLRAWTLRGVIQPHIDVYVSRTTFNEVQRAFPYMIAKEQASGGGDVPEFRWHIFEDYQPFDVAGVEVVPMPVHHGRYFSEVPPTGHAPTPNTTTPSTPVRRGSPFPTLEKPTFQPYICHAFSIDKRIIYMGDVSFIPEATWPHLLSSPRSVIVLDCLRPQDHMSHFGLGQAVQASRKIKPTRTYLSGFGHEVPHDEYVHVGEILGGATVGQEGLTAREKKCLDCVEEGEKLWVRPAHDGLRVWIGEDGKVRDKSYDA
ncbi:Metallo-hydrolase/oxidoreductase [Peniophora sp. CONT]|nr:Metallo-hydrolase/oxidoreductase [Peniophora sp. CONT]